MVELTDKQLLSTIVVIALGTMFTRALPFLLFRPQKDIPPFVQRLQLLLPGAAIGLLVVYALKDIQIVVRPYGLQQLAAITLIVVLHRKFKNPLLSIGAGTALYMFLLQIL